MTFELKRRPAHDHAFGQEKPKAAERRTMIVIVLTAATMIVEVAAGIAYGSMALLADGLHMASHAAALGISWFAYVYARSHARDPSFSFGTGKVNALAGYTGAMILLGFTLLMTWESARRLIHPVPIGFDHAIGVAVLGLIVNGVSVRILHGHGDDDEDAHDHNLRSAYLHVLTDALTSILAIAALVAGKLAGAVWLDPLMGFVAAGLITHWSVRLARQSSDVLLDRQAPDELRRWIVTAVEEHAGSVVTDLHVWSVAPGSWASVIAISATRRAAPAQYKRTLAARPELAHVTVEVTWQDDGDAGA